MLLSNALPIVTALLCASSVEASNPKRGLGISQRTDLKHREVAALTSNKDCAISWYYQFHYGQHSLKRFSAAYEFVMQQPSITNATFATLPTAVERARPKVLMTWGYYFARDVTASVAAWRKHIIPLRAEYPDMKVCAVEIDMSADAGSFEPVLTYMSKFIEDCPDCKFDYLTVNYYGKTEDFRPRIKKVHQRFPKYKIYINTIGFQSKEDATPAAREASLKSAINWLDKQDYVERYALVVDTAGTETTSTDLLNSKGQYTDFGKFYLGVK